MTDPIKGLHVTVYHAPDGDFTNDGASSKVDQVTIVGTLDESLPRRERVVQRLPRDSRVFTPDATRPPVVLVVRQFGEERILSLVPADEAGTSVQPGWFMFGGNYGGPCDSRLSHLFRVLTGHGFYGAIAIHDRQEI